MLTRWQVCTDVPIKKYTNSAITMYRVGDKDRYANSVTSICQLGDKHILTRWQTYTNSVTNMYQVGDKDILIRWQTFQPENCYGQVCNCLSPSQFLFVTEFVSSSFCWYNLSLFVADLFGNHIYIWHLFGDKKRHHNFNFCDSSLWTSVLTTNPEIMRFWLSFFFISTTFFAGKAIVMDGTSSKVKHDLQIQAEAQVVLNMLNSAHRKKRRDYIMTGITPKPPRKSSQF